MFEGLFQPMHLLIIAGIALLVFGPKKLPELGKGWATEFAASNPQWPEKREVHLPNRNLAAETDH